MGFTITVKNLGRLPETPIEIGGLTVLAGPNATGKSFLSKALYSTLDAVNANHALVHVEELIAPVERRLARFSMGSLGRSFPELFGATTQHLASMAAICEASSSEDNDLSGVAGVHKNLVAQVDLFLSAYQKVRPVLEESAQEADAHSEETLEALEMAVERLGRFSQLDPREIVLGGFQRMLLQNLVGNFQVRTPSDLKQDPDRAAVIDIEGVAKIVINDTDLEVDLASAGFLTLQRHSRVIYLESPVYWKIRSALKAARFSLRFRGMRRQTLDVPKHFLDLDSALQQTYAGDSVFPEVYKRLTADDVLGGRIALDEQALRFVEADGNSGRRISLPLVATGAVNLGIIALLIEQRIIDRDAFLFIDEPESNLHPGWQVEMVEVLIELANSGVNVVMATHSSDIVERLASLVSRDPALEQLVVVNHFSRKGVNVGTRSLMGRLDEILGELTGPYTDSYMMRKGGVK